MDAFNYILLLTSICLKTTILRKESDTDEQMCLFCEILHTVNTNTPLNLLLDWTHCLLSFYWQVYVTLLLSILASRHFPKSRKMSVGKD